jgi:hypothetical protein
MKSVGNQAYTAKWKQPGKTIEIVGSAIGNQDRSDTCEFKVTLHDYVYDIQNGTLSTFTQEQYKVRIGAALPKTGPIDSDISHYPLRLSILAIDWAPPLNGTRTAAGKGNLQTHAGLSSVDFTTSCILPFRASPEGRYYAGQWTQEGSTLVLLLRTSGELATSLLCTLQTNLHTDIYVRDASGAIKAVPPEEYRRTMLKMTASAVSAVQGAGKPGGEASAPAAGTLPDGQPTTKIAPVAEAQEVRKTPETTAVQTAPGNGSGIPVQKVGRPDAVGVQTTVNAINSGLPNSGKMVTTVVVTEPGKGSSASTTPGSVQAAALYRKACDGGSTLGCRNLAIMYSAGNGVSQSYAEAATLYRKACNEGDPGSCSNLGGMYAGGTGVPRDYDQAVTLYRKACDSGNTTGCSNLGLMYAEGTGVPRDYTQAVTLYRKACDAGLLDPCVNLGVMYESGTGVSRDHTQAVSLFRKACDGAAALGCNNLGVMYQKETNAAAPPQ